MATLTVQDYDTRSARTLATQLVGTAYALKTVAGSLPFGTPSLIDEASATATYLAWSGGAGAQTLVKIAVSGTVTSILKATDTWANRATASYADINA